MHGLNVLFHRRKHDRGWGAVVRAGLLALLGLVSACAAAQGTELRVNVYLDQRRNDAQMKYVEADV